MKRNKTSFHTKPRKPLKRTQLRTKTPLRAKKHPIAKRKAKKAPKIPDWIKSIPEGIHGAGTYQKRLWKLVSDFVRIRDWYTHKVCAATGVRFKHWNESHAGHLKPYTNCNALYKFDTRNIHMQSGYSNKHGNYDTFRDFEKVVRNRGYDFDKFEKENQKATGASLRDSEVKEAMKKLLISMKDLPEQPVYYERARYLLKEYEQL